MASSVTIDEHDEALIDGLVESGRYKNAGDVVRAGLRLVAQREQDDEIKLAALRVAIQEGLDSGPAVEFDPKILAEEIKARGRERLAAAKNG